MSEWQTRRTQNPLMATSCGFKSHCRHCFLESVKSWKHRIYVVSEAYSFFLYKAAWNPEPMIYITSRRFTAVRPDTISIKVYANTDTVSLYRADETTLIATLTTATECGIVWEFNNASFSCTTSDEVFVVKGAKDGFEVRDEVTFYHEVQEAPGSDYDYINNFLSFA